MSPYLICSSIIFYMKVMLHILSKGIDRIVSGLGIVRNTIVELKYACILTAGRNPYVEDERHGVGWFRSLSQHSMKHRFLTRT